MALRKGKTKSILENSIDSALLAVEIYNKPRTSFRVENYISLMAISWTKLFHAYFQNTIGDKFYYKEKNGRYKIIDGDRKAWELIECIKHYSLLSEPVKANLKFIVGLRNKIEHRYLENQQLDLLIFGECQSLLYNYETLLVEMFGDEYSINLNLAYALQFSHIRTAEQQKAQKKLLSREIQELQKYVEKYRSELTQAIFDSNEYSIKLIQIPKITNTNRNALAIEFVNWSSLNDDDRENYDKLTAIIKDKVVKQKIVNLDMVKPGAVVKEVEKTHRGFKPHHNTILWKSFNIRPHNNAEDKFDTNDKYCIYDEAHDDYLYTQEWIIFVITLLNKPEFSVENIIDKFSNPNQINNYI